MSYIIFFWGGPVGRADTILRESPFISGRAFLLRARALLQRAAVAQRAAAAAMGIGRVGSACLAALALCSPAGAAQEPPPMTTASEADQVLTFFAISDWGGQGAPPYTTAYEVGACAQLPI